MTEQVHQLDARNLLCPMPVIRTQNRVQELKAGDLLLVQCTDPGAKQDVPAWCRINGHELVGIKEADGLIEITIRVGSS
jgi:tRNA 2-thiouridine synthesizing protein A